MIILGCLLERNQVVRKTQKRTCRIGGTKLGDINNLSLCDFEKDMESFVGKNVSFCPFCGNNLYSDFEEKIDISNNPNIVLVPLNLNEDKWVAGIKLNTSSNIHYTFSQVEPLEKVKEYLTPFGLWDEKTFGLIQVSERER